MPHKCYIHILSMRVTKVMSQVHSAHTHRHLRKWSSEGTANSLRDPQTARSLLRTGYRGKTVRTRPARCVCPRASTRTPWWTGTDPWVTAEPGWAGRALHFPHMSPFCSSVHQVVDPCEVSFSASLVPPCSRVTGWPFTQIHVSC